MKNYYVHVRTKASLAELPAVQAEVAGQSSRFFSDPTNERPIVAVRQPTPEEVQAIRYAEPVILPAPLPGEAEGDGEHDPLILIPPRATPSPRL